MEVFNQQGPLPHMQDWGPLGRAPNAREVHESGESHCPDSPHESMVRCAAENKKSGHTWKGDCLPESTLRPMAKGSVRISTVAVPAKIHLATEIKVQRRRGEDEDRNIPHRNTVWGMFWFCIFGYYIFVFSFFGEIAHHLTNVGLFFEKIQPL